MTIGPLRMGIDIGGTFTDVCVAGASGIVGIGKVLTDHRHPAASVEDAVRSTLARHRLDPHAVASVVHGTTLVTNALIERRGAATALVTTEGFRDVIEMGREHRYELYDLNLRLPRPLVPRHLRFGVPERTLADGTIERSVDFSMLGKLAVELATAGVDAVAVCFLHSYANPANEVAARAVIAQVAPRLRVAISSEVNPEIREYERFSTTVANVYVQDVLEAYLNDLVRRLNRLGLVDAPLVMLSSGGLATIDTARTLPIRLLESGPAGGALGAVAFGRTGRRPDQLAFDMGGTTAKLCMIESGRPLITHRFEVDRAYRLRPGSGIPVRAPVIDMIEIGTGGGSLCRVDQLGLIAVGPDSAGSDPGPVCYGRGGTRVTVTDADAVLGYLDAESFLGGTMRLDIGAATAALDSQIARPLGVTVAEAAWGVHATANQSMANAARVHAMERGQDPAGLALFVSGGNGPLHGPGVARALGCATVVAPPAAGVLSAAGFLVAPISIDLVSSRHSLLSSVPTREVAKVIAELEGRARSIVRNCGVPADQVVVIRSAELRFVGQGYEIEVPLPDLADGWRDRLTEVFAQEYTKRYGSALPTGLGIEVLTWRVIGRGPDPDVSIRLGESGSRSPAAARCRPAYFSGSGGYVTTAVYRRTELRSGDRIRGPALIEESESTLVVDPDASAAVLPDGSIALELRAEGS